MCFQGFVYFACGHNRIMTHNCEYALTSGNPYFIRHQCPDYNSSSERPNFQCGLGRYYCSQSVDGPFLDHVHQAATTAQSNISIIDTQLVNLANTRDQLTAEAKVRAMSDGALMQTKEHKWLVAKRNEWTGERNRQQITQIDATAIIQQALRYYKDGRARFGNFNDAMPRAPFVPGQSVFGTITDPTTQSSRPSHPWCGTALRNQQPYTITGQHPQLPSPARTTLVATPRYTVTNTAYPPVVSRQATGNTISTLAENDKMAQQAEIARQRNMQPVANQERKVGRQRGATTARSQRSRTTQAKADDDDSAEEEIEVVRRSARVRNKKVNYAEDGGSSVASLEPSPAKSDMSAFSPLKSNASSPEKDGVEKATSAEKGCEAPQTLRRPVSSLNDKIADWSKRSIVKTSTSNGRRAMPDMKDLLNSSPSPDVHGSSTFAAQPEGQSLTGHDTFEEQVSTFKKPEGPYQAPVSTPRSSERHQPYTATSMAAQQRPVGIIAPAPTPVTSTVYRAEHHDDHYVPWFRPQHPLGGEQSSILALSNASWNQDPPSSFKQVQQDFSMPRSYQALEEELTEHEIDTKSYYGSLRRSFDSVTPLPPAKSSNLAHLDLEPKKRRSSAFIETPEPRKRMRLSLPGEEVEASTPPAPNWLLGQGLTMNTADGGAPYVPTLTQESGSLQSSQSPPVLSISFKPPIATMTAATAASDMGALGGVANSTVQTGQQAEHAPAEADTTESGPDFSDIDWGHHEHDLDAYVN